ncbi:hypothetical protein [Dyadobacter tibetensis]|uniref:hypothetical protein n=1 Tax=Dyadobacter tibetensis TaxID=1211851 RepID=UPI00046FE7D3|nr:hypothetical protein [Dyadobacter tibetensis]
MKHKFFSLLILCLFSASLQAQSLSRVTSGLDLGLGYQGTDKIWAPAIMYHQDLSLKHFPWMRLGWGVRTYGIYGGASQLAPKASASAGDTLSLGKISTNGISFLISASVSFGPVEIGANTDLIGLAFGTKRSALYTSASLDGEGAEFYNSYVKAGPSSLNALPLLLSNNNGQSEIYARIWFNNRFGVKLGYNFGQTSYSSVEKLDNGQTRFSTDYHYPYLGLTFPLYN